MERLDLGCLQPLCCSQRAFLSANHCQKCEARAPVPSRKPKHLGLIRSPIGYCVICFTRSPASSATGFRNHSSRSLRNALLNANNRAPLHHRKQRLPPQQLLRQPSRNKKILLSLFFTRPCFVDHCPLFFSSHSRQMRTSDTHAIRVDFLPDDRRFNGGRIGMTFAPGPLTL
jgi:hypothetical protein